MQAPENRHAHEQSLSRRTEVIDWTKVARLMRLSIIGSFEPSDQNMDLINAAYKADPVRYGELHTRIKNEEMKKINPFL